MRRCVSDVRVNFAGMVARSRVEKDMGALLRKQMDEDLVVRGIAVRTRGLP